MTSVVILAGDGPSTWVVYNALAEEFQIAAIVVEENPSPLRLLQRRARKLGLITVAGQAAFVFCTRLTERFAQRRRDAILRDSGLSRRQPAGAPLVRVESANSAEVVELLQRLQPRVVVVNGTRILSEQILTCVDAPFLNMHAGITPMYRGVHGAYWALANGDASRAGVTVHLVDTGVDTGAIVAQATIRPTKQDSFHTYPYLQLAAGVPLLQRAVENALSGSLRTVEPEGDSHLYYHPTIWEYLAARLRLGVR